MFGGDLAEQGCRPGQPRLPAPLAFRPATKTPAQTTNTHQALDAIRTAWVCELANYVLPNIASETPMDDDDWYWAGSPLWAGSVHEMNERQDEQRSRLWQFKSTSKAACMAADKRPGPKERKVGFYARRPR